MRRLEAHHNDLLNIMGEGILDGGGNALPHSLRALHCMRRQAGLEEETSWGGTKRHKQRWVSWD